MLNVIYILYLYVYLTILCIYSWNVRFFIELSEIVPRHHDTPFIRVYMLKHWFQMANVLRMLKHVLRMYFEVLWELNKSIVSYCHSAIYRYSEKFLSPISSCRLLILSPQKYCCCSMQSSRFHSNMGLSHSHSLRLFIDTPKLTAPHLQEAFLTYRNTEVFTFS